MRIGIDARLLGQTGVGRYLQNLIIQLASIDKKNDYYIYLRDDEYNNFKLPGKNFLKRKLNYKWHSLIEQIMVPIILQKDKLDIAHFPYFNVPILYPNKYVLTVHDLIINHFSTGRASTLPLPLYKAKRIGYKLILYKAVKSAKHIFCISNTTAEEVKEHYKISNNKLSVTPDALDILFSQKVKIYKAENIIKKPYILYVGNAYPHKNLERLIKAVELVNNKTNMSLVFAGKDDFFYKRLKKITKNKSLRHKFIFSGKADDKKLINLYSFAKCLVFPSLMEGFGLPAFESLSCGCLPVLSDIKVFREIWNDRLSYFNPLIINDMAEKILMTVLLPKSDYEKNVKYAKEVLSKYSFKDTALRTLDYYKKVVNNA